MKRLKEFGGSLLSRKLILAVVGALVAFGNSYWNWGLKTEEVWAIVLPLLAYVGIEGLRDIVKE